MIYTPELDALWQKKETVKDRLMICQTCLRNRTQKEQTQLCDLKFRFRLPLNCTTRSPITNYSEIRCIELHVLQTSKGFGVFLFRQSF